MNRFFKIAASAFALASAAGAAQAQQSTSFELNGAVPLSCAIEHYCGAPDRCTGIDLSAPVSSMTTASVSLVCNGQGGTRTIEFASANGSALKGHDTGFEIPYRGEVSGGAGDGISRGAARVGGGSRSSAQALPLLVNNWPVNGTQSRSFAISTALSPYNPPADKYRDVVTVSVLP
jgi:opacity protein-like surface antigen